ncbi:MAG: hypothetical protein NC350_03010 [Corallococcus sp.]|nr:hypothetical protein [Corallococcus sp.]
MNKAKVLKILNICLTAATALTAVLMIGIWCSGEDGLVDLLWQMFGNTSAENAEAAEGVFKAAVILLSFVAFGDAVLRFISGITGLCAKSVKTVLITACVTFGVALITAVYMCVSVVFLPLLIICAALQIAVIVFSALLLKEGHTRQAAEQQA